MPSSHDTFESAWATRSLGAAELAALHGHMGLAIWLQNAARPTGDDGSGDASFDCPATLFAPMSDEDCRNSTGIDWSASQSCSTSRWLFDESGQAVVELIERQKASQLPQQSSKAPQASLFVQMGHLPISPRGDWEVDWQPGEPGVTARILLPQALLEHAPKGHHHQMTGWGAIGVQVERQDSRSSGWTHVALAAVPGGRDAYRWAPFSVSGYAVGREGELVLRDVDAGSPSDPYLALELPVPVLDAAGFRGSDDRSHSRFRIRTVVVIVATPEPMSHSRAHNGFHAHVERRATVSAILSGSAELEGIGPTGECSVSLELTGQSQVIVHDDDAEIGSSAMDASNTIQHAEASVKARCMMTDASKPALPGHS